MEEVPLSDLESRFYSDLFLHCDEERTGKVHILKATDLYRLADISNEKINEITSLAGIPSTAFYISRVQFYACLKLIAAQQSSIPLRQELIATTISLPLPKFKWTDGSNIKFRQQSALTSSGDETNLLQSEANCLNSDSSSQDKSSQKNIISLSTTNSDVAQCDLSCGDNGHRDGDVKFNSNFLKHRQQYGTCSPEAWSTNSDSPTPTNSITERPWFKETLCFGLLGDEHKQLLGTEEESSDRHSSDEDNDIDLNVYQITQEQRDYYSNQFNAIQHDSNGLLSGQDARVFFEKSRIPIEELRHIWQLCDVTKDGALSLAEFTAAMHLVVLRRNNIPLPIVLPRYLHPNVLQQASYSTQIATQEAAVTDLLLLGDDNEKDNINANTTTNRISNSLSQNEHDKNVNILSTSSQASIISGLCGQTTSNQQAVGSASISPKEEQARTHPPPLQYMVPNSANSSAKNKERTEWAMESQLNQWTKFIESPTSTLSSPGPKPVNFDMQRTAQAVVSDPQILHPVPLRVTPVVGNAAANSDSDKNYDDASSDRVACDLSLKQFAVNANNVIPVTTGYQRDSLQNNDLRAIQRPQAKKLLNKNAGALPPPPQREPNVSNNSNSCDDYVYSSALLTNKVDPPPTPPPRPHHHGRSNSLDLNKFKLIDLDGRQIEKFNQVSFDLPSFTCFADFTKFTNDEMNDDNALKHNNHQQQERKELYSLPPDTMDCLRVTPNQMLPASRLSFQTNQHSSAFEIYRKPNSFSPSTSLTGSHVLPCEPFGSAAAIAMTTQLNIENDKTDIKTLNQMRPLAEILSKQDGNKNETDILRYIREQNNLLFSLCNDLNTELLTVQTQKKEICLRLEALEKAFSAGTEGQSVDKTVMRMGSSVSAPVTANVTGSSVGSAVIPNI